MTDIYVLIDPRDNKVRYVGKTWRGGLRYKEHLYKRTGRTHKASWIQQLNRLDLKPIYQIIAVVDNADAAQAERGWIKHYRDLGFDLTNHTDGGDGVVSYHPTTEQRKKMSDAQKHRQSLLTLEERRELTAAAVHAHQERGHVLTDESKELISRRTREAMADPVVRQKISSALTGRPGRVPTEETKAKISQANSGRKRTPEQIQRLAESHRGHKASLETRAKMQKAQQERRQREALQ